MQPKQFGVLAGSAGAAALILAVKFVVGPSEVTAAAASLPSSTASTPAATPASVAPAIKYPNGLPEQIEVALDERPARDPFVALGAPAPSSSDSVVERTAQVFGGSSPPQGVRLQATLNGTRGVFNENIYAIGDSFVDAEGRSYSVSSIGERFAMVSDGHREWRMAMGGPIGATGS
ncbi:MAG: hypothetical protein O2819_00925 [Planctomycetota bacterium]|nr:hypothetical protein [Planctomycetota bacterium]